MAETTGDPGLSHRGIAPSCHSENTNCLKAPDKKEGHSLELWPCSGLWK